MALYTPHLRETSIAIDGTLQARIGKFCHVHHETPKIEECKQETPYARNFCSDKASRHAYTLGGYKPEDKYDGKKKQASTGKTMFCPRH